MISINVQSNIDVTIRDERKFHRQIPFAISQAMNDASFDVRDYIVKQTWPRSFNVRNRALPGAMFRVLKRSSKRDLVTVVGQRPLPRSGILDWVENQAEGGSKVPTGRSLAIPPAAVAESLRTSTGRIAARNKPRRVTDRKDTFMVYRAGRKRAIIQKKRGQKKGQVLFVFATRASIPKRFMFYEDAERVFLAEITPAFYHRLGAAIMNTRSKPTKIATATQGYLFP
jgi:hypothetical protein